VGVDERHYDPLGRRPQTPRWEREQKVREDRLAQIYQEQAQRPEHVARDERELPDEAGKVAGDHQPPDPVGGLSQPGDESGGEYRQAGEDLDDDGFPDDAWAELSDPGRDVADAGRSQPVACYSRAHVRGSTT